MMLLTLIENALKHGLAPLPEVARSASALWRLTADSCSGWQIRAGAWSLVPVAAQASPTSARLKAMYGAAQPVAAPQPAARRRGGN
jgi:hypothetical protein